MGVAGETVLAKLVDVALAFLFRLERDLAGREGAALPGLGVGGEELPVPFPEEVVVDVEVGAFHRDMVDVFL
jgi:hypothetical protein